MCCSVIRAPNLSQTVTEQNHQFFKNGAFFSYCAHVLHILGWSEKSTSLYNGIFAPFYDHAGKEHLDKR